MPVMWQMIMNASFSVAKVCLTGVLSRTLHNSLTIFMHAACCRSLKNHSDNCSTPGRSGSNPIVKEKHTPGSHLRGLCTLKALELTLGTFNCSKWSQRTMVETRWRVFNLIKVIRGEFQEKAIVSGKTNSKARRIQIICSRKVEYTGEVVFEWASVVAQTLKNLPAMQETLVPSWDQEYPLEKGIVTLQYSCLENSMDRGDRRATVHRVTKSWTWQSNFFIFKLLIKSKLYKAGQTRLIWFCALAISIRRASFALWIPENTRGMGVDDRTSTISLSSLDHYQNEWASQTMIKCLTFTKSKIIRFGCSLRSHLHHFSFTDFFLAWIKICTLDWGFGGA